MAAAVIKAACGTIVVQCKVNTKQRTSFAAILPRYTAISCTIACWVVQKHVELLGHLFMTALCTTRKPHAASHCLQVVDRHVLFSASCHVAVAARMPKMQVQATTTNGFLMPHRLNARISQHVHGFLIMCCLPVSRAKAPVLWHMVLSCCMAKASPQLCKAFALPWELVRAVVQVRVDAKNLLHMPLHGITTGMALGTAV